VIELRHAIDFRNVSEAQEEYAEATKGMAICNVLFDLHEVPHADSASLAVLIDLVRYMKDNKVCGDVGLCNLSNEAKALIDITKVASLFRIYPTSEVAIQKLA
jgi:anti-anti-sigma factor